MKKLLLTTALLLSFGTTAFAQTTLTGEATSEASSSSSSSGGNAVLNSETGVYIDQRGPSSVTSTTTANVRQSGTTTQNIKQSGTTRNEFAPAVSAPAFGSGHPCGLGGSLGISIIGGGITGGATRVDDACLLAQMGYSAAAMQMIAARDSSACKALVSAGAISANSYCGDNVKKALVRGPGVYDNPAVAPLRGAAPNGPAVKPAPRTAAGTEAPPLPVGVSSRNIEPVCMMKPGTTRTVVTNAPTQQGRMACAASLGVRG